MTTNEKIREELKHYEMLQGNSLEKRTYYRMRLQELVNDGSDWTVEGKLKHYTEEWLDAHSKYEQRTTIVNMLKWFLAEDKEG